MHILNLVYMYAEDMAVGTVSSLPDAHWQAILQTVHQCLELVLMCLLMMPPMRAAVKKVCSSLVLLLHV